MTSKTIQEIAEAMKRIDFGMLSTTTDDGLIASRPMSNNREVRYEGDSFFFSFDHSQKISDIQKNPQVGLTYVGSTIATVANVLGKPPLFLAVQGIAELIREKTEFEKHWSEGLERWFPEGTDTPNLILIKVKADRIHYWDGEDDGELVLRS